MARDPETALQEMRMRMHHIETAYLRAKEYLKSSEWQVKRDEVLLRLSSSLGHYRQGQDATSAVYVIAQAKQIMLEVQEVSDVIVEFESLRDRIREQEERMM
jgi:hypothetical protein